MCKTKEPYPSHADTHTETHHRHINITHRQTQADTSISHTHTHINIYHTHAPLSHTQTQTKTHQYHADRHRHINITQTQTQTRTLMCVFAIHRWSEAKSDVFKVFLNNASFSEDVCPHTTICVLIRLCVCSHANTVQVAWMYSLSRIRANLSGTSSSLSSSSLSFFVSALHSCVLYNAGGVSHGDQSALGTKHLVCKIPPEQTGLQ